MQLEALERLTRDQRKAAATLGRDEARYMVDTYYQLQHERITANNRLRAVEDSGEPNDLLTWWSVQSEQAEKQIAGSLSKYAESTPWGRWALDQKGIGPVIAAGILSRVELRPTVGAWWKLAGLDPTVRWEKGQVRPWNAALKRICWLAGESFVKVSGREDAFYGRVYVERKAYEQAKNEAGDYAEFAALQLTRKRFGDDTKAKSIYLEGKLPPAHLHARAKRYAVKMFLSHLHHVWYVEATGELPPKPFAIAHLGHAHMIDPPGYQ